ncbi:MAG: valine--tRNA ligase [Calditrichaceae bacterium]|nr:valine--tRNA ligase [Calditrichaceae bacterium]
MKEIPSVYDPAAIEKPIYQRWLEKKAFAAFPDERENRYVIMMPLPNVTGALHMGHAMDNVMQDLLIRWRRMMGDNTLWMPGTDHAGIATQAVVEKRLFELEGKTRQDIGREALVERIWAWKDQYQARIIQQQQAMGCSCDWERQRFTMDAVCAAAVRETFFRLFKDALIFRGYRLVNWDCKLQTSVSDDELVHETVAGHFWHIKYPVIGPKPGEPEFVAVATTRPETMLGDTAVAVHPHPETALEAEIAKLKARINEASSKDRVLLAEELRQIEERKTTHLPLLKKLVEMAKEGRKVMLPLQERPIPLILDEWAKPELGSGCVKITPAHDYNDYEVWQRHKDEIEIINILNPDGTLNDNAGEYAEEDRFYARERVVADLETRGLLQAVENREIEVGHSDRSKTPVEPYLSRQWFVRMGDVEGARVGPEGASGIVMGRGTAKEFRAGGLAQAAMDAVNPEWKSPSGRNLTFYPDPVRYRNTYYNWLAEKRDWCISRQLWWGHRIPIWHGTVKTADLPRALEVLAGFPEDQIWAWIVGTEDQIFTLGEARNLSPAAAGRESFEVQACIRYEEGEAKYAAQLESLGLYQDPDVLDTWFSSAIWPHSTLGWPDPENAQVDPGQSPTGSINGKPDALSYYYPGSCLVTGRDIITLWVARMQLTGLYNLGDVPFTDCFIHATILDGKGERMSKSKGNGIDPVDIIELYGADALRYVLCDMQTGTQDIRLPVQAISPFTGEKVDLAVAKHGRTIFTYIDPQTGEEFDVLGTMPDIPAAKIISDRFEIGKNFCNKLWNAARFAMHNLNQQAFRPLTLEDLAVEDRWILSRLSKAIAGVTAQLGVYNPSAAINAARDFFWGEFCDWYLEMIKPRMSDPASGFIARQVLATVLDQALRLFHPFIPFITEAIWELLNDRAPARGISEALPVSGLLILASWPRPRSEWENSALEGEIELMQEVVRKIRDVRNKYTVPHSKKVAVQLKANGQDAAALQKMIPHIQKMAAVSTVAISAAAARPKLSAVQVLGDIEIYVEGVLDRDKELKRLQDQRDNLVKGIASLEQKLQNPNFANRAPAEVVESKRQQLRDWQTQLNLIEENIKALD